MTFTDRQIGVINNRTSRAFKPFSLAQMEEVREAILNGNNLRGNVLVAIFVATNPLDVEILEKLMALGLEIYQVYRGLTLPMYYLSSALLMMDEALAACRLFIKAGYNPHWRTEDGLSLIRFITVAGEVNKAKGVAVLELLTKEFKINLWQRDENDKPIFLRDLVNARSDYCSLEWLAISVEMQPPTEDDITQFHQLAEGDKKLKRILNLEQYYRKNIATPFPFAESMAKHTALMGAIRSLDLCAVKALLLICREVLKQDIWPPYTDYIQFRIYLNDKNKHTGASYLDRGQLRQEFGVVGMSTALHHARCHVKSDTEIVFIELVQLLMAHGMRVDVFTIDPHTDFIRDCAECGQFKILEWLLSRGIKPKIDNCIDTVVSNLLKRGPLKVSESIVILIVQNQYSTYKKMLAQVLDRKCDKWCIKNTQTLLQAGADPNTEDDKYGVALISLCCYSDCSCPSCTVEWDAYRGQLIEDLLDHGANIEHVNGGTGLSQLKQAIQSGSTVAVEVLLKRGAIVDESTIAWAIDDLGRQRDSPMVQLLQRFIQRS